MTNVWVVQILGVHDGLEQAMICGVYSSHAAALEACVSDAHTTTRFELDEDCSEHWTFLMSSRADPAEREVTVTP